LPRKGTLWKRCLRVVRLAAVRRWYGPSGCVRRLRRLRRLLEEESAVRMLVGGGQFLYQGPQRCFNDGDLVFEPVGFLDQC
jgi:hypothetical protein